MADIISKPATVFVCVSPQAVTQAVQVVRHRCGEDDFRQFIYSRLDETRPEADFISDDWVFRYDIPDAGLLPPLDSEADQSAYFRDLRAIARQEGIVPSDIVTLRDAFFCRERGIDPLSPEGRHSEIRESPGYVVSGTDFKIYSSQIGRFPTCRAVELGHHGVFLYALDHEAGYKAYNSLMQHCADHFFDKGFDIERLRIYDVHRFLDREQLSEHRMALNFNINHFSRLFSLSDIPSELAFDHSIAREGVPVKEYITRPDAECYTQFVTGENIRLFQDSRPFNIALLDHIEHNGYPDRLAPEWNVIFPLRKNFADLEERIITCDDMQQAEQLQSAAKDRATRLLEKLYPDRRKSQETRIDNTQRLIPEPIQEKQYGLRR